MGGIRLRKLPREVEKEGLYGGKFLICGLAQRPPSGGKIKERETSKRGLAKGGLKRRVVWWGQVFIYVAGRHQSGGLQAPTRFRFLCFSLIAAF